MERLRLVNSEQIKMLGGLEQIEVKEILYDFLTSFEERLPGIAAALAEKASSQLREEGHQLKGAALSCGFDALGVESGELEMAADAGDLADLDDWVARVELLVAATREELSRKG